MPTRTARNTVAFKLLAPSQVESHLERRNDVPGGYGPIERITATGRTRCRACRQKIAKGTPALRFGWDWTYSSSFTATTVQICAYGCRRG